MSCDARMKIDPTQSSPAMAPRTTLLKRYSRKSPTVRSCSAAAIRRILGPTQNASTSDPIPAEPTHHQTATPVRYARDVAPTVDPAPIFPASIVAKMSPGPSRRPATKKSDAPRTRRPIHRPIAISASEYVRRTMT